MTRAIAITAPVRSEAAEPIAHAAATLAATIGDAIGEAIGASLRHTRKTVRAGVDRAAQGTASAIFPKRLSPPTAVTAPHASIPHENRSDEELFVMHRNGDPTALRVLIRRYSGELHGFLTRLVGSRAGADDVFQEAFLQVHLAADAFDSDRRFRPWLYTIAANKGRDYLRRNRRRSAISLDAPVGADGSAAFVDLLSIPGQDPAAPLEESDERELVKQVIEEMPPHFREILLLSYFQKLSYAQIADSLQIPLGTVKSRLHAAVASFAQSWKLACARRGIAPPDQTTDGER